MIIKIWFNSPCGKFLGVGKFIYEEILKNLCIEKLFHTTIKRGYVGGEEWYTAMPHPPPLPLFVMAWMGEALLKP